MENYSYNEKLNIYFSNNDFEIVENLIDEMLILSNLMGYYMYIEKSQHDYHRSAINMTAKNGDMIIHFENIKKSIFKSLRLYHRKSNLEYFKQIEMPDLQSYIKLIKKLI